MKYKDYQATVWYEEDDKAFHGNVIATKSVLHFSGQTVEELENAFHRTVDDYLALCEERGISPAKQYSGRVTLRIPPNLHAKLDTLSQKENKSLNELMVRLLEEQV